MWWVSKVDDVPDVDGPRKITSYEADSRADLPSLPKHNGKNHGSGCLVLADGSYHKLGTNPAAGINGWVEL